MQIDDREVDVRLVLDKLGVQVELESNGWLLARCPLHVDQHRSFAIHEESGGWICYAGCGKGTLPRLVSEISTASGHPLTPREARQRLKEEGEEVSVENLMAMLSQDRRPPRPPVAIEDLLYDRSGTYAYMTNRGFRPDVLKAFGVGRDSQMQAVVIPAYEDGVLVGLVKRRVKPGPGEMKYDYTRRWAKSQTVFALDRCEGETVVLVEGVMDAMWLHQWGFPGAALLGSRMSDAQLSRVVRRFRRVVLALDPDEAGIKGTLDAIPRFLERGLDVYVVNWPMGEDGRPTYKDIQECREEVVNELMDRAKHVYSEGPAVGILTD